MTITYEDQNITFTYPIAFTQNPRIQLTVDYTRQFSGTDMQPGVWIGNVNSVNCKIYGNSTILSYGTDIWFHYLLIGY